ncbi:GntR family transcriptional regulator [Aminobacter aminovorans]|uniref:HTH-type transcriptional repressor yvoA n=2 Tax=Aminobacter TaxID=31988 RepID=A0A381IJT9_AMIAI|nr:MULTISPECIES: GntR family transcriptional regulator [Aminobacter]MBB6468785.1 GntR family transcriptional regulator [Aminobacter lissarensis]TCS24843.1 GntR family transcriptional regulator [Aminobacter aminovorans]SUY28137.1 HTH-type transcriptional repressor yvoA [Aminobacter aminovorans]
MGDQAILDFLARQLSGESGEPLYRRLEDAIKQAISTTQLKRNAVIPSERTLCDALGISRVTVRKAIDGLVSDGLLDRRQGAKTVVSSRLEKSLATMTSFSEDMRSRGLEPGCVWISREISRPSPAEMMALGISGSEKVVRLRRLRTADDTPIAIEIATLPARFVPDPEAVRESLYEYLEATGALPVRALQRMQAKPATDEERQLLATPEDTSLLVMERRCFLADGQIVEFTQTKYRGDVYDFVIELMR